MKELVQTLIQPLVNHPEEVEVTEKPGEKTVVYQLKVHPEDAGQVIGKQGRTIKAIRTVVAASSKDHRRVRIEIDA